jgi:negative regulator of sigma E activity
VGATQHTDTTQIADKAGDWWLTVVGEAPLQTLNVFSQGLERSK